MFDSSADMLDGSDKNYPVFYDNILLIKFCSCIDEILEKSLLFDFLGLVMASKIRVNARRWSGE